MKHLPRALSVTLLATIVMSTSACGGTTLQDLLSGVKLPGDTQGNSEAHGEQSIGVDVGVTTTALEALTVRTKGSMAAYSGNRTLLFGEAWTDDNDIPITGHNGCRTREDILARDLANTTRTGCFVDTGVLQDPYTGRTISYKRGLRTSAAVQVDHVVSLGNVWASGGNLLSQRQRVNIANDPINLQSTDGPVNGAKGDSDASEWLPPNRAFHCMYVAAQINVKQKYRLSVTNAEKKAMQSVLTRMCNSTA